MTSDRDGFEKAYAAMNDGFCPSAYEGEYGWADAQRCWEIWQAARAQVDQGAEPVAWECSGEPGLYDNITRSNGEADHHRKIGRTVRPLVYGDTQPEADGWIKCSERLPKLGQRVQLFSQGVIQHMMPLLDEDDEGPLWDFEVHDYNPPVDFARDQWMPMPQPPVDQEGKGDE